MTRRRYETQALVGELKRERRNAVWLITAGVGVLGFLAFYFTRMGGEDIPTLPVSGQAPQMGAAVPAVGAPPVAAPAPPPAPKVSSPAPASPEVTLSFELPRATSLWLDGKLVGKDIKTHAAKLAPGKHTFTAKLGRREVRHSFEAEAGLSYTVVLDARKRRWDVAAKK